MTPQSKELLRSLIQNAFNSIDFKMEYIYNKAEPLIDLAKEAGLIELAETLEGDKTLSNY